MEWPDIRGSGPSLWATLRAHHILSHSGCSFMDHAKQRSVLGHTLHR